MYLETILHEKERIIHVTCLLTTYTCTECFIPHGRSSIGL